MSDFTPQQTAAIEGRGNLLVVAGAGTGKTHTLIARCLRLLSAEQVSLENILLVTFTEAAAAEMRGRLRKELQRLQENRPTDDHLAQQLALLETASISTLHGFCLQLAREHFHVLGLDPQFNVLDEQQTRPLQSEALDELLERHFAGTSAQALAVQALIRASGRGSDQQVRKWILQLHHYAQSLPDPAGWLAAQQGYFENCDAEVWRARFTEAVGAWRDEWQSDVAGVAGETAALRLSLAALQTLPDQPTLAECAATLQAVAAADVSEHWPRGTKGRFRDPLEDFFDAAEFLGSLAPNATGDPLQQDWEWARTPMLALIGLVQEFALLFATRKRELGGVDFSDLEQSALRLLHDPGIASACRKQFAHVFVDEYQDINAAQDAILTRLSRSGAAANRFLVGDVKQSIYRFRRANPQIFQRYQTDWSTAVGSDQARHAGGRALSLTENFRSREGLLRFLNPLFAALMRQEIGGVAYEPLVFGAPERRAQLAATTPTDPCVEFHLIAPAELEPPAESEEVSEPPIRPEDTAELLAIEREARLVARRLRDLHASGHRVWDRDAAAFRPVRWGDMAVLLRSPTGRAEAFAMEFSKAGVPLSAARDGFFASLEISDLLNLLKLLDNPLQDVPLLAVLRSPLVGLSLTELARVRAGSTRKPFWAALVENAGGNTLTPEGAKVREFLDQFARWRELVRQTSLSQCLETALRETHFEAMLLAGDRGPERVTNLRRLLDLARQFDPYQRQGLYRFLRFVQMQADADLDLQSASPPAENAVRLMSIHKSKGLEFPIVVLAGMGTRFNEQDLSAAVLVDESLGLCPKITPPESEQSYPSLTHWLARNRERRELRGEELRLTYVALTRARDHLILVGTTKRPADEARWNAAPTAAINTREVVAARSQLDWLLLWLAHSTAEGDWSDARHGQTKQLRWQIHAPSDPLFQRSDRPGPAPSQDVVPPTEHIAADVREQLYARLNWQYPFIGATREPAKTSVTALRRRALSESEMEAAVWNPDSVGATRESLPQSKLDTASKLSAAAVGLAHHTFLQHIGLEQTGCEAELRAGAEQLRVAGLLTVAEVGVLDFAALARFWRSGLGEMIRSAPGRVQRELAFTARFGLAELQKLLGGGGQPAAPATTGEFVVVQGVADLVVVLPAALWLVDFKTDAVAPAEIAAKAARYTPQLQLYALALSRIYQQPVTECQLYFLAAAKAVSIQIPSAIQATPG